ncbi:MAG TPA: NAD(P)/FAD-dependent oxidoreductase [Gemmataceae bacterium]|nr:NAD(P)/FAD-dependent oxidoreductase [Gemmataceae bacterium]
MPDETPEFTIVGAGLAGTLLACYLGKAGHRVDVYEKRPDPRGRDQVAGRSINLAISVRGIQALRGVGLADDVLRSAIPMRGRMMHAADGKLTFQPYGTDDSESINSISRAGLNVALLDASECYPSVRLFFCQRCTGFDPATGAVELVDDQTGAVSRVVTNALVGADGAYSAVRQQMQVLGQFDYSQEYLPYGYKELHVPAGKEGSFAMEKHALHIWPRRRFMTIALPNLDGSFTCTLFWPLEGPNSFAALRSDEDIRRYFAEEFSDLLPLIPALVEDYRANPVGSLVTIRCHPWHVGGKVVLLGDAAHAVVPFLGQGMNAAFEDCTVLSQCLAEHGPNTEAAFRAFEARRKEHVDTLADLCLENFVEMRDKVGSRAFLLKKKAENTLHALFPTRYLPLYTMISFTTIPYADAVRRARRQNLVALGTALFLMLLIVGVLACWLG